MFSEYMAELNKVKKLLPAEEILLWQKAKAGDASSHNLLMRSYQHLVFKLALSCKANQECLMELVQEGTVGLLEAAERYDYRRGVAFSVYATQHIKGKMLDFLAREYKFSSEQISCADTLALVETIPAEGASPYETVLKHTLADKIKQAMGRLPTNEKRVLTGIYLNNLAVYEIAKSIHVTTAHVYRLQKQGVRRIRGMLARFMAEIKKS